MLESPPMIGPLFAAINVSPIQARPRMPMTAVMPAWQVLVLTILSALAPVNRSMSAARAIMMMAIVMGMERVNILRAGLGGAGGGSSGVLSSPGLTVVTLSP